MDHGKGNHRQTGQQETHSKSFAVDHIRSKIKVDLWGNPAGNAQYT